MVIQVYQGAEAGHVNIHSLKMISSNILVSDVFIHVRLLQISPFTTTVFTSVMLHRHPNRMGQLCIISNRGGSCEISSRIKEQWCMCPCNVHL